MEQQQLAPELAAAVCSTVVDQGRANDVQAKYSGQWEWCIVFTRENGAVRVFLAFGPTAVVENGRLAEPLPEPDYSKVFAGRVAVGRDGIDRFVQSEVGLDGVPIGLSAEDTRLRDALLSLMEDAGV